MYILKKTIYFGIATIYAKLFIKTSSNIYWSIQTGQEQWLLYFWGSVFLEFPIVWCFNKYTWKWGDELYTYWWPFKTFIKLSKEILPIYLPLFGNHCHKEYQRGWHGGMCSRWPLTLSVFQMFLWIKK